MHDRTNVLKHVHDSATDEDPNKDPFSLLHEGEDAHETMRALDNERRYKKTIKVYIFIF